jgi:hypothetical protein
VAIKRPAAPAEPKKRSLAKGFHRLACDLWAEKAPVKIALLNGHVHQGLIANLEGDTISLDVAVDRFNVETQYIPMSSVVSIAADMRAIES